MATPIVPWIGGKRRLVDLLLSRFPPHTCYVEVFAGGAAVFFARNPAEVEALARIKGKAVVSINDHPAIRECFKAFDMEALKLDYTVGGAANRVERGELVIYSWDRSQDHAGLF